MTRRPDHPDRTATTRDGSAPETLIDEPLDVLDGEHNRRRKDRLKMALFGRPAQEPATPQKLGRFVILDLLGQGGMGVVYSAYDPVLDRRVALKLLHPGSDRGDRERLLREAKALARLSHPNVVPVHDVGVLDDQVFVVMAFVVGSTLGQWARAADRSWREVLDVYLQAGRGLMAAHAHAIVHRDFKPDNALVGDDLRVRVVDFGLARAMAAQEPALATEPIATDVTAPDRPLGASITATNAIMGTPAYMSPEQFSSAAVGPASDQFSFCASLYEALYGQRPFSGATLDRLASAVCAGLVEPPPEHVSVPRWLHATIERGLQPRPIDRYPSMAELLTALSYKPSRRRRRSALALGVAAVLAVVLLLTAGSPTAEPCQTAARELGGVWNPDRLAALQAAFSATGHPYASEALTRVQGALDSYGAAWIDAHRDACLDHHHGRQSPLMLDRRMACLDRRRSALDHTAKILTDVQASQLEDAVESAHALPPIAYCADMAALIADVPPPEQPDVAAQVVEWRDRLLRARALDRAGRYQDSIALAAAVVEDTRASPYVPVRAEAHLALGRAYVDAGQRIEAIAPLREAMLLGLQADMHAVAVEALARRIYAETTTTFTGGDGLTQLAMARAMIRDKPRGAFAHALLLNNAGVGFRARGDREQAIAYFTQALDVMNDASDLDPIELTHVLTNLAMVTPDPRTRGQLLDRARQRFHARLGPVHPRTLHTRYLSSLHDPDIAAARDHLRAIRDAYLAYHPELGEPLLWTVAHLVFVEQEFGQGPSIRAWLQPLLDDLPPQLVADHRYRIALIRGHGLLAAGDCDAASPHLRAALAQLSDMPERPWFTKYMADARLGIGMCEHAAGRHESAVAALESAYQVYEQRAEHASQPEAQRRLAWARMSLARSLWHQRVGERGRAAEHARRRAIDLLDDAERWYRAQGAAYAWRLRASQAWRRSVGAPE